jgi:FtsP/CotA-like multicopper oxidase with cupredoxin domain
MNERGLTRRDALKVSLLGAAAIAVPWQMGLGAKSASLINKDRIPRPYTVPFVRPPVLAPTRSDATTDYYRVVQKPFVGQILPGVATTLWGYNGMVPGPTIRVHRGRRVVMRQVNQLPPTHPALGYTPWTSTHLHGHPSLPQYDGYASDVSYPGQWKDYVYENNEEARTLWYHDHGVHHTAENVYMGLAAQYHLTDPAEEAAVPLPRGTYDVPLILGDVKFARDGSLLWDDDDHNSHFGDVIVVNGKPWPTMRVEQRKYRFRFLNGCLSRGFTFAMSNGQPMTLVATDAGLMATAQPVTSFRLGMAERLEVVIDFAALPVGRKVQLINRSTENSVDYDNTGKVMQFEVSGPATDPRFNTVPTTLLETPHPVMTLPLSAAKRTRRMRLKHDDVTNMWTIDDKTWQDVVASNFTLLFANPREGDVEIWEIETNGGGWFHPLHIHFVDFRVLTRNGQQPRPEERGPKDVVYVDEGSRLRLIMQFSRPAGPRGRYMIHCHNLTHEDHDMMAQFQIGAHDATVDPINAAPPRSGPETPL